nr:unnamed protein product [Callosobruchus chinensis]
MEKEKTDDTYNLLINTIVPQIKSIQKDISSVRSEIYDLKAELDVVNDKSTQIESENVQTLESRLKKYNLVIYGLSDQKENTEGAVMSLIRNKLKIEFKPEDLRDCCRIGKQSVKHSRPTIIKLVSYTTKQKILEKSTGIFISRDYTSEEYAKRKLLHKHLVSAREKGNSSYIKENSLYVNGDKYTDKDLMKEESSLEIDREEKTIVKHIPASSILEISGIKSNAEELKKNTPQRGMQHIVSFVPFPLVVKPTFGRKYRDGICVCVVQLWVFEGIGSLTLFEQIIPAGTGSEIEELRKVEDGEVKHF